MKIIKKKLESQRGASMSFALLLFLVCAVVSSVVIVAGTAASGRMSRLPQMDQRYYAVTSAAELLCTQIDGKKIIVESDKKTGEVKHADPVTLLTDASESLVKGFSASSSDGIVEETAARRVKKFSLKPDTGIENASLDCIIEEELTSDGLLTFLVSNDTGGEDKGVYTLRVIFSSNMKKNESDSSVDTAVTSVEWKLHSITKIKG